MAFSSVKVSGCKLRQYNRKSEKIRPEGRLGTLERVSDRLGKTDRRLRDDESAAAPGADRSVVLARCRI
jgi:hypothetical protein